MNYEGNILTKTKSVIAKSWNDYTVFIAVCIALYLLRLLIAIVSGHHGSDITDHLVGAHGLIEGKLLYVDADFFYPPLHAYFQAFLLKTLGDTILVAKLPAIIGDAALTWALYHMGKRSSEVVGRQMALAYLLLPLSVLTSDVLGLFDSVAIFLMILGIHYFLYDSLVASSFFIGFGAMYKFFPFLAAIPMLAFLGVRKAWKNTFVYGVILLGTCAAIIAPYLYFDVQATLQDLVLTGSKYPDSFSIYNVLPLESTTLPFALQAVLLIAAYLIIKKYGLFADCTFESIALFVALFVMLNKNIYPHYFLWAFPFFAYWFISNEELGKLTLLMIVDTALLSLFWLNYGELVNSNILLPLTFQALNWAAIVYIIYRQRQKVQLSLRSEKSEVAD
ncbi:hypothetical protein DSECCO2_82340 [anaerobic digester metagenome]